MAKPTEPHAEWAMCTWVTLVSMGRFSVVHQSAGKPTTRPFFVAIATSYGRIDLLCGTCRPVPHMGRGAVFVCILR